MVFEKEYSVLFSWTNENNNMFHYSHKIYYLYNMICDGLWLHGPGDILVLFVKNLP